ncbi:MAG: hypothetical protein J1F18_04405 [Lachnospiraceae bacterium]|nr:hypothetical protein [Lachnospiraceae bacterium]
MDIGSLYNVLIGATTRQINTNTGISRNITNNVSFGDILAAVRNEETVSARDMFSAVFSDYNVDVKAGNDNVSASKLNYGQMVINIPDELRDKMEADPQYAWEVVEKVQKYKADYDRKDNALASAYGYNQTLHQMSKRYCFSLDDAGSVKSCQVTGGILDAQSKSTAQSSNSSKIRNNQQATQRRFTTTSARRSANVETMPIDALSLLTTKMDYLNNASYFGPTYAYNDILRNW